MLPSSTVLQGAIHTFWTVEYNIWIYSSNFEINHHNTKYRKTEKRIEVYPNFEMQKHREYFHTVKLLVTFFSLLTKASLFYNMLYDQENLDTSGEQIDPYIDTYIDANIGFSIDQHLRDETIPKIIGILLIS